MITTLELTEQEVREALTKYINDRGHIIDSSTFQYIETEDGIVVFVERIMDNPRVDFEYVPGKLTDAFGKPYISPVPGLPWPNGTILCKHE